MLTPLAVDPAHPFPYISGLSLNLAVMLVNPKTGNEHFARVKVPPSLPRLRPGRAASTTRAHTPCGSSPLEDVIAAHLDQLFPGMEVQEHFTFRVTRNEDLEVEEDDAENLLTALEKELTRRRFGPPVRLEVEEDIDDHVLDLLVARARRSAARTSTGCPARSTCAALFLVADLERSDLQVRPVRPAHPPRPLARPRAASRATSSPSVREQGRPAAPPLRLVLDVGPGVHRAGRRRPPRPRDQADALPHLR